MQSTGSMFTPLLLNRARACADAALAIDLGNTLWAICRSTNSYVQGTKKINQGKNKSPFIYIYFG